MAILEWLQEAVFANKLAEDVRTIETNSLWTFEVPSRFVEILHGGQGSSSPTRTTCGLLPPVLSFYYQLVVITILQTVMNAILGAILYKIVVEPQQKRQTKDKISAIKQLNSITGISNRQCNNNSAPKIERWLERDADDPEDYEHACRLLCQFMYDGSDPAYNVDTMLRRSTPRDLYQHLKHHYWYLVHTKQVHKISFYEKNYDQKSSSSIASTTTSWLFVFGIALPLVVLEPLWFIHTFDIQNVGLGMVVLATPIVNATKITEAYFGFAPPNVGLKTYVLYFSCLFGMEIDETTRKPKRATWAFLRQRVTTLARDFVIVPFIVCILRSREYEFFALPTNVDVDSMDHSLGEMFSWQHLCNNFFVALLLSCALSQSTIGVSLLYNLMYGVQTYEVVLNPMLKSKSVTDFWGRRWNMLVHRGLKNGVYKPTRKTTDSRMGAVLATFVASGILHEYVNYALFEDAYRTGEWKQMLFFGWNGVLLLLEYTIGHWSIFRKLSNKLPPFLVTALVLCLALPLAHLFTGPYIKNGWFESVYIAEPVIVCQAISKQKKKFVRFFGR